MALEWNEPIEGETLQDESVQSARAGEDAQPVYRLIGAGFRAMWRVAFGGWPNQPEIEPDMREWLDELPTDDAASSGENHSESGDTTWPDVPAKHFIDDEDEDA